MLQKLSSAELKFKEVGGMLDEQCILRPVGFLSSLEREEERVAVAARRRNGHVYFWPFGPRPEFPSESSFLKEFLFLKTDHGHVLHLRVDRYKRRRRRQNLEAR